MGLTHSKRANLRSHFLTHCLSFLFVGLFVFFWKSIGLLRHDLISDPWFQSYSEKAVAKELHVGLLDSKIYKNIQSP